MAESLTDRQFEVARRVQPGRTVRNRKDSAVHSEEYALAVVSPDGNPLTLSSEDILRALLMEQRRTNQLLEILIEEEVGLADVEQAA